MGKLQDFKLLENTKNEQTSNDFKKLAMINQKLIFSLAQQDKKIILLERKLHKIGEAEEQRDWLLNELTKKITTITAIRSDLLKKERFSAIGELSSRLAHDMRNPLSIILNSMDVIKIKHDDKLSPEVKKLFLMIERASSRMAFQLDEVLNFVRQAPMTTEKKSILEIITSSLSRIVVPNGISIELLETDSILECDPRKLESVFSNLFMNAIQAMGNKGIIKVRIIDDGDVVTIDVEDSGPGIHVDNLEKIFEPLFTTKSQGTGLGLASVRRLVEQHGGQVSVKLNPTVFSVILPHSNPVSNSIQN